MRVWRLSDVCLSRTSSLSTGQRGLIGRPCHTWLGHHFQVQKVKGQLAGGGGILWRPPAQLVAKSSACYALWLCSSNFCQCISLFVQIKCLFKKMSRVRKKYWWITRSALVRAHTFDKGWAIFDAIIRWFGLRSVPCCSKNSGLPHPTGTPYTRAYSFIVLKVVHPSPKVSLYSICNVLN